MMLGDVVDPMTRLVVLCSTWRDAGLYSPPSSDVTGSMTVNIETNFSPSYSTKSQDSGFSDESNGVIVRKLKSPPKVVSKETSKRTEFFNENEEDSDPNLTQLPDSARERVDTIYRYSVNTAANQVKELLP